jgi:hypothetical protein
MFNRCAVATIAGLVFLAQGRIVEGAPIVFTDRAAFDAATQPNLFDDFSAPVQCAVTPPFCDITYSGVTFRFDSPDYPMSPASAPLSLGALDVGPTFVVGATFSPSTAIGFDVFQLGSLPFGLRVMPRIRQADGTEIFGASMTVSTPGFFGLHLNDGSLLTGLGLSPIQTSGSETLAGIDNLSRSVAVPEPATLVLFGAGAVALLARRRRDVN